MNESCRGKRTSKQEGGRERDLRDIAREDESFESTEVS